jgi:transposase
LYTYRDGSALTALSYASMIEDPANFKNARAAGATIGLTPRSYPSGEIDESASRSNGII